MALALASPRYPSPAVMSGRKKALDSPVGRSNITRSNVTRFPQRPSRPSTPVEAEQKTHTPTEVYGCPYSGQQYSGACPVSNCPANIRAKRHPSGCMHNCFPDKDLGVHELAYALGKDSNDLRQTYEAGMESLKHLVLLDRCLDWVRVRSLKAPVCGCGAVIGHSACTAKKCRNRRRMERLLSRYPLSVEPLAMTGADVGKLFYWRTDLERVFKIDLLRAMNVTPAVFARYTGSRPSST